MVHSFMVLYKGFTFGENRKWY